MAKNALHDVANYSLLNSVLDGFYLKANKIKRERQDSNFQSLNSINHNRKNFLKDIVYNLKEGDYTFSKLTPHFIKKDNGKTRIICAPTIRDKIVQKAILLVLHNRNYSFKNIINYGFIPGSDTGVKFALKQAITLRNDHPFAYKTDIISFFDRIDRDKLKSVIKSNIRLTSLHELLFKMIDCEINSKTQSNAIKIKKAGIQNGVGLRQGMPISPYLSNLFLKSFDEFIIKNKLYAVRYADDLIFFADHHNDCLTYDRLIRESLKELRLEIPELIEESKTVIYQPNETVEFLGLGIEQTKDYNYRAVLTEKQFNSIKGNLDNFKSINYCIDKDITISKLLKKIDSIIDGYESFYDGIDELEDFRLIKERIIHIRKMVVVSLLKNGLNHEIDFNKLSKNQRKFWEIDI